jgi:hypothetical protein
MIADDYADWWHFADPCLDMLGEAPYLDCQQERLSEAGFVVLTARDFAHRLRDLRGDLDTWLYLCKGELAGPQKIAAVAAALRAVGAPGLAGLLENRKDRPRGPDPASRARNALSKAERAGVDPLRLRGKTDPEQSRIVRSWVEQFHADLRPGTESPDEVELFAWEYVDRHQAELAADVARHGDPRRAAGFSRWRAGRARERRITRLRWLREQDCELPALRANLRELVGLLRAGAAGPTPEPGRRRLSELCDWLRAECRNYGERGPDELTAGVRDWLREAEALQQRHPGVFLPTPAVATDDPAVCARLAAIGPYIVERGRRELSVRWRRPPALASDLVPFDLEFYAQAGAPAVAGSTEVDGQMFALWDAYRVRHPEHVEAYKRCLVETYRGCSFGPAYAELYPADLADEDILSLTEGGAITVRRTEEEGEGTLYQIQVDFAVEWDQEHGIHLVFNEDGGLEPAW